MSEWKLPWAGGCRCGALRFEVTKPPLLASACHCTGCQRMTGSAFSLTLTVPKDGFAGDEGRAGNRRHPRTGAHHRHCDRCKSWVYTDVETIDWFVNVRATMLDDPTWFVPFVETWTSEGLPWALTGAARSYPTQPAFEDYEAAARPER